MDDAPELPSDDATEGVPGRTEATGPISDRVRISGADVAGERTGEVPVVPRGGVSATSSTGERGEEQAVYLTDEPAAVGPAVGAVDPVGPGQTAVPSTELATPPNPANPVLPHWTEPPTGEVPAVLARDTGDEPKSILGPTWREEDADWVAHEEQFEPAMFGGEHSAMGSLNESDSASVERRPWEFDLEGVRAGDPGPAESHPGPGAEAPSTIEPITEEVPVVSRGVEPAAAPAAAAAAAAAAARTVEPDELTAASDRAFERVLGEPTTVAPVVSGRAGPGPGSGDSGGTSPLPTPSAPPTVPETGGQTAEADIAVPPRARPTGTSRLGRARRNGLRPGRMRAKRPEEVAAVAEPPLAAEPPGAAVTEVPGAGRKRGLASLAAADRTAERVGTTESDRASTAYELPPETHVGTVATTPAEAAVVGTRPKRRTVGNSRPRTKGEDPSDGGPPTRRIRRPTAMPVRSKASPEGRGSLGVRIGTGLAVGVIALVAFKLGTVPSLVLAAVLVTFAAGECFGVLRRAGYQPATLLGLAGTVALMWGAYAKGVAAIPAVLVLVTVFTLLWYLLGIEGSPVAGTAATLLTVGWISLLGAYAGLLLAPSNFPHRHGIAFLLGAAIVAVVNDVSALAIGSWMGSHPLAPRISPNKTWEGLIGSAVVTVVVSTVVVGAIHPWDAATAALLGLVVAVVAPIGDLCESLLKRDLNLKDMGTLLPGHGGVLDRLDAMIFVVPATYYLVRALNIG